MQDRKIVQSWRASDWPEGHLSTITITLAPAREGTKLTFGQAGVPEEQYEEIRQGWYTWYWEPLKAVLEKGT